MSRSLTDFISDIRGAATIEDEKFIIATEQAQIRAYLRKMDPDMRPRIVSKLVFLDMIGQNPAWGQMEAITLMAQERYSYKRIGYISTAVLLDQTAELTVLVTQTLLQDLQSFDPNVQCLALSFIANHGNSEVCRSVATTVQKLLDGRESCVVKAAGMATAQIVKTNPDLCESYKNSVQSLLNNPNHGVVISGINLVIQMIKIEPKLAKSWSQFAIPFTKILKSLTQTRPTREFSYGVYNDPYMQIKAMQALSLLRKRSDELDGILQSIISSTEARRNTGRAILYQAVETIVAISRKSSLRGLAFNQVGRLLSLKDPNVLYSALSSFARVLYAERAIINRGSVDSMALQRYKSQIVKCLDHQDPSIRRRALDVISALIDEKNVETLIPEILAYVRLADAEFRSELVAKIYVATQRFAPSSEWNFDTVHQILIDSGNYVSSEIVSSFCELIAGTPSIQPHAVQKLSESLLNFNDNQTLTQVAAFVVGEFSSDDSGISDTLRQILLMPQTKAETKNYIITALAKMAARFGTQAQIAPVLVEAMKDNNLEVQQRAGEMVKLLMMQGTSEFLAPVQSGTDEHEHDSTSIMISSSNRQSTEVAAENEAGDDLLSMMLDAKAPTPSKPEPTPSQPKDSLLGDLLDDFSPSPQQQQQRPSQQLLSLSEPSQQQPPQQQQQQRVQQPVQQQVPQAVELLRKDDYIIYGQTMLNPNDKRQYALRLVVSGTGASPLSEFKMAFTPSVGWQIKAQPPDRSVLGPKGSPPITQVLYLLNMNNAPFQIQTKVSFKFGTQPINETGVISVLPPPQ
ncbi:Adaptin N terminal region family protein [Tritrichomonas foetus]|uniref:AP-1 complex subunit gamma n=1 Tax=Tritrichomonas foetus TaxID=1144522 RepID=A0A1J4KVF4_9EUKA|nr:Adaptin N terminal region family protein [Tritrichomonas foetus]|eukprot:OHT15219.1 Adaptin N terminal region family protein [Tritrichomonas foetus]